MGLLSWTIIGFGVGWMTNYFFKRRCKLVRAGRVFAGVSGALIGGFLSNILVYGGPPNVFFAWQSLLFSILSAILLVLFSFYETRRDKYSY
ncbi:MAG: hypothetical protein RBT01_05460 [Anaerolineaceae bacterium]|jgi:uncharacterized membrane protein YeaQ/YmgE (transglycosylase-associated protein family)|nr:hypothetical protein [Anaerolineaceae bacterium]